MRWHLEDGPPPVLSYKGFDVFDTCKEDEFGNDLLGWYRVETSRAGPEYPAFDIGDLPEWWETEGYPGVEAILTLAIDSGSLPALIEESIT